VVASRIRVLIADDHPIFLGGIKAILEKHPELELVGEAYNGDSAWEMILAKNPDVAVLDIDMPGLDGLQIARRTLRQKVKMGLIMLTMHKREELFREALDLGVLGYLLKDDMAADVVKCIRMVSQGEHFIAPALSSYLVRSRGGGAGALGNLSATQKDVLKLIAKGLSSKEIATELGISHRTVENHRFRIGEKLNLRGANSVLRFALEHREEL
jgi:DNA-binding NarL/FixJ family response regulator